MNDETVGLIGLLSARNETIAVAESLTGGLACAELTSVPGASACVRGGVVAYATDLKFSLLGVPADLLKSRGAVDPDVAGAMASGVARVCQTSWGLATTGVAGPDLQDGKAVGTVFVAAHELGAGRTWVRELHLAGSREEIRSLSVRAVLSLAREVAG